MLHVLSAVSGEPIVDVNAEEIGNKSATRFQLSRWLSLVKDTLENAVKFFFSLGGSSYTVSHKKLHGR